MRKILFYSENFCGEHIQGGLEVATFRIAKGLKESGHWEVFNAFRSKSDGKEKSVYKDVIKLKKRDSLFLKQLTGFIVDNEIDVVVNMSRFFRHELICKAVKNSGRDVKIIFMQHFAPGSEFKKPTFRSGFHLLKLNPFNPIYWLRASLYPLLKLPRQLKLPGIYRSTYNSSDKIVLLSEQYSHDYSTTGNFTDNSKFIGIPNIYDETRLLQSESSDGKEKRVLILSRMDEIQKRISVALKIWAKIEKDPDFHDWHLDIVGSGHNTDIVKRLIKKLQLKNVTYHGWQKREPFLQKASILMSTSEYEGLPLAILEAQVWGVVPIAFDSYASLRDVIVPFENGVVIDEFGDIDTYTKRLMELMYDEDYRKELSRNGRKSISRFSQEKIIDKWLEMLNSL